MKKRMMRGITLLELIIVVAVSGILVGFAGFTAQRFQNTCEVERQIKQLYFDMMNVKLSALQRSRAFYVSDLDAITEYCLCCKPWDFNSLILTVQ